MEVIDEMRERIEISFEGTGVMDIMVVMPDPVAAAQVCNSIIINLKRVAKKYHTRKAQKLLEYANKQYQKAREEFLDAQKQLATFKDQHANLISASAQSRLKYLQSKYNLAYSVFKSAAQSRVKARMHFQKSIPVFNIIQHPNIPYQRYRPSWIPILLVSVAIGLVLSFLVVSGLFIYHKNEYS